MNYEVEYLKNEIKKLEYALNNKEIPQHVVDDIADLVNIASEMKQLLIDLRKEQIDYNIAKRIDNILKRSEMFN
jgi:hypothetical protein